MKRGLRYVRWLGTNFGHEGIADAGKRGLQGIRGRESVGTGLTGDVSIAQTVHSDPQIWRDQVEDTLVIGGNASNPSQIGGIRQRRSVRAYFGNEGAYSPGIGRQQGMLR